MNERQYKMIDTLLYSVSPLNIAELKKLNEASERTIKYDIAMIRKEFENLKVPLLNKKGIGYYISPEDKQTIIQKYSLNNDYEDEKKDHFSNIMLYFLFIRNPAKKQAIAEKLFFSELSIKNFIKEEKDSLTENMVIQLLNGSEVMLTGPEREIRHYYIDVFFEKIKNLGKHDIAKNIYDGFPLFKDVINVDWILQVEKILQKLIIKWNIWISEDSYIRLVLHILIAHLRRKELITYGKDEVELFEGFENEYNFAKELLEDQYWGITEPKEILNLVEVMTDNTVFIDDYLEKAFESRLEIVVLGMLDYLYHHYPTYKIDKNEFIKDVSPHLRQILRRHQVGIQEKINPLYYQIKKNYHDYFSIAKKLYKTFCDEFQLPYSEDEVSYLTIYLFKNIVEKREKKYYVYIVCGTGRGFSKLLRTRVSKVFDNIEVIDCLSSFRLLKEKDVSRVDFIISTIDLPELKKPVVKISSFLGQEDINNIQRILDYGAQVSVVPLPQEDKMALENLSLEEMPFNQKNALLFSNLFLSLFDLMMDLPAEYKVNQEKILGITIHLIIALPRYYESDFVDDNQELIEEVIKIEKEHPVLAKEMIGFLETIENLIGKGIPYGERYALYQYIFNEGD